MNVHLLRFASALLCCAAIPATPAIAQTVAPRSFDLPAEPLGRALGRYSRLTGIIVVADASLTRGRRSQTVRGAFSAEEALTRLLQGTSLRVRPDGHSGYVLERSQTAAATETAPEIPAQEILVYGRLAKDTTLTVPQSVDVLGESAIESTRSDTVGDVLRFIPGASRDGSPLDAFGDTVLIRGFQANQTVNGISPNKLAQARDTIAIDRVEVLKGPASVLYGQLQPGAVINIVTKQPKRSWEGKAGLNFGRFNDWRGTVDLTGPLAADGALRFRLTAAYDDADSFVDYWHRKHLFVAPVVAFDLGEATTVTVETLYTRNELKGFFNGLPVEGTVLPNPNGPLPRSLGLTDPSFAPSIRENSDISARVEHRFSDRVTWRTAVSWTHEKTAEEGVFGLLGWEDAAKRTLSRAVLTSASEGDNWTAHTDLGVSLDTGPISHELVLGGDYTWFNRTNRSDVGLAAGLDVYAPVYQLTVRPSTFPVPSFGSQSEESTRTAGLFAQDRIGLTDQLKLVAGLRWSRYRQNVIARQGGGDPTPNSQNQTSWTTQFGLLYMPTERVSLFANRTTSFLPVQGVTANGTPLKPETGVQYELGAKALVGGGRVSLNAALFYLKRGNVAVSDRVSPSALIAIGAQVAKGFELSASGRPIDGLTVYLGYAYTEAETTEDTNTALIGKRIRNIPRHGFVARGDYVLQDGALAGLSLGGSATYSGKRAGDIDDSFELPGYWRFDAQASYPLTDNVSLGASIENIANKRYYSHAFSFFEVWPGAPRTWRVSLTTSF